MCTIIINSLKIKKPQLVSNPLPLLLLLLLLLKFPIRARQKNSFACNFFVDNNQLKKRLRRLAIFDMTRFNLRLNQKLRQPMTPQCGLNPGILATLDAYLEGQNWA